MKKHLLGCYLILIAVVFALIETAYFGWNFYAQSIAERVCDNIADCLLLIGVILILRYQKDIDLG